MYKIYYVEDEVDLANVIEKYLKKEGYEVKRFEKGEEVLNHIDDYVDLWILDIMLKGNINGYDILKAIRKKDEFKPIIFTSARDQDIDKIMGLELGGDDYLSKPFSPRELILRVKSILKRTYKDNNNIIYYKDYLIDVNLRKVIYNNEKIELTSKEFDLLKLFLNNKNHSFSRVDILKEVWEENYFGSDRVVDDLMRRLRQKLPLLEIETIYGFGYRLNE